MCEEAGRGRRADDEGVLGELFEETFWCRAVDVEVERGDGEEVRGCEQHGAEAEEHGVVVIVRAWMEAAGSLVMVRGW